MNWLKKQIPPGWLALVVIVGCLPAAFSDLARGQDGDDSNARRRPSARLSLASARAVTVGQFPSGAEWQEVKFNAPVMGRYFCLESLSAQDGRPYAAIAELDLLDAAGDAMDGTGWKIAYADSEESDREDGSAENAIDGDPATFWHTQWGSASPNHPHHLVLDLGKAKTIGGFRYLPRPGDSPVGGRIRDYRIYIGNDLVEENVHNPVLPARCYLFGYFVGVGEDGLHLAWSLNGYRWDAIDHGRVFLKPEAGDAKLMRDPCLLRDRNGMFHLVWTARWTGNYIGYAFSPDLIHWSPQRVIPVMAEETNVANCWAPEICWDARGEQYLLFWASTVTNQAASARAENRNRIYATTTKDFKTFSPTRLMFDPGFGAIDATLWQRKSLCRLIFQNDRTHQLHVATGENPEGPFGKAVPTVAAGRGEGPTVLQIGEQSLILFHLTPPDRFGGIKSSDWEHWEDISPGVSLPPGAHQGTVLEVPGEALRPLLQAGRLENGSSPEASGLGIGDWIWTTNVTDKQICRLWRQFSIPPGVPLLHAELRMTADNGYTVYLDGKEVGRGGDPNCLTDYDLTWLMSPGSHVLAIEAFNETMDAGVIAGLTVKLGSGKKVEVFSGASWRVVDSDDRGWLTERRERATWFPARIVGYAGRAWWQYPYKIIEAPPLLPPAPHFWQQTWLLAILLLSCIVIAALCLSLGLRLAFQGRADRLLKRERARIARDIHDDLGAGLTQLTLLGELVLRETPREEESLARLNELCARARALLGSLDEIVWAVNPRRDTVQDFAAFISGHAQEFLSATTVRCRLEVPEELPAAPLDLPQRRNLLLAVKEAIRNVARHSNASEATLTIGVAENRLRVMVEDNGRGFAAESVRSRNGLANMRQRLLEIGGSCSVTSAPGSGCRVIFTLPLSGRHCKSGWFPRFAKRSARVKSN